jgi:hypothetical protein
MLMAPTTAAIRATAMMMYMAMCHFGALPVSTVSVVFVVFVSVSLFIF